jgi:transposase
MPDIVDEAERVIRHLTAFRALSVQERYAVVDTLRGRGHSRDEIATATGYSRERVRWILKRSDTGEQG